MCARIKSSIAMSLFKYLVVASLLLTACAQAPKRADSEPVPAEPQAEAAPQVEAAPVLPNVELSNELLYEFLLSEIANQRGYKTLAVELTKKTCLIYLIHFLARKKMELD